MIRKILVANRGEIAIRVFRTALEMGIRTVAVYSEPDANMAHTLAADEAVAIGGSEATESYLRTEKILEACRTTGADSIHPGYGFLSENADFADDCETAGITFIGPSGAAMRKLGSKIDAKQLARQLGVPIAPGYFEPGASPSDLLEAARAIGFPVMLKASAGGGGRGMRIVQDESSFLDEAALASDEALKGFGDGELMVEKLVRDPRHLETQMLADGHGNVAVLFERECSIQRRHQKLLEEAPSVYLETAAGRELWPKMKSATEALARGAGYTGAGTVEFMVDGVTGEFYFLEVNARLQVEHPVTESITGVDLVRQQIRIAQGEPLEVPTWTISGNREAICGWSIEARIVAEDPARGFLPSIGKIVGWSEPQGPGIRVDTGYGLGAEVSRFYDSLIAKVVASGATRSEAIARLRRALLDFHVLGVRTNVEYLLDVLAHPEFGTGAIDTGFLSRHFSEWEAGLDVPPELGSLVASATTTARASGTEEARPSVWAMADGYRIH